MVLHFACKVERVKKKRWINVAFCSIKSILEAQKKTKQKRLEFAIETKVLFI
jgi:hypothetical protein